MASDRRGPAFDAEEAFDAVGEVGEPNLGPDSGQTGRTHEQAGAVLLASEHHLDGRADPRSGRGWLCAATASGRGPAAAGSGSSRVGRFSRDGLRWSLNGRRSRGATLLAVLVASRTLASCPPSWAAALVTMKRTNLRLRSIETSILSPNTRMAISTLAFTPFAPAGHALARFNVQRAFLSSCASLDSRAAHSSGIRPSFKAAFSASMLRWRGAAMMESSMIYPDIARSTLALQPGVEGGKQIGDHAGPGGVLPEEPHRYGIGHRILEVEEEHERQTVPYLKLGGVIRQRVERLKDQDIEHENRALAQIRLGKECEQHQAHLTKPTRLDEVGVRRSDRVAVDAFGYNALASAALDRAVERHDGQIARRKSCDQHSE